jgi:hypothetical protein
VSLIIITVSGSMATDCTLSAVRQGQGAILIRAWSE